MEMEKVAEIKGCSDLAGALQLTAFGALSVAEVEGIGLVVARRKSRAYSGIHASGKADDSSLVRFIQTF